jgi:hypothetical protein
MSNEDLSAFTRQRVNVREGAMIDADIWTAAHTYHESALDLHTRALHGVGIVMGLEVEPSDPPSRSLILQPGVAIDADGRLIHVDQPLRLTLPADKKGVLCVALRYAEVPDPDHAPNGVDRLVVRYHCVATAPPLPPTDIEVARVAFSDSVVEIRRPADPWDPKPGNIDIRSRRQLRPSTVSTVDVATLITANDTWQAHRTGLMNLVRELQMTAPFVVRYAGDLTSDQAPGGCQVLYICGAGKAALSDQDVKHLQAFVQGGGLLYAEPCAEQESRTQENGRFIDSLKRLLGGAVSGLHPVEWGHSLLSARHVFGTIPEGVGGSAPILSDGRIILNPNDYGCYWSGRAGKGNLPRPIIREALEFGVNVVWSAAQPTANRVS